MLDRLIAVAASQIGGYFPGRSPYGEWYAHKTGLAGWGYESAAFCAMGLSWCADQAGALGVIPLHAYCPDGVNWFKRAGQWTSGKSGAQRGDVVYFNFSGGTLAEHVGIVESGSGQALTTIEFNTSSANQANGRTVARKARTSNIVGFGRPQYTATSGGTTAREDIDMTGLFADLYRRYLGRESSPHDRIAWSITCAGMTADKAVGMFMASRAERESVRIAYREILGREAGDGEVKAWYDSGATIGQLWHGVQASPEAAAKR
jgi:hypothetical protein